MDDVNPRSRDFVVTLRVVQLQTDTALLQQFYDDVLVAAFRPEELGDPYWEARPPSGDVPGGTILALVDDQVVGGIVGEWFPASRVLLISWLAVHSAVRGRGVASTLMQQAARHWYGHPECRLVVAEIEDPRYWSAVEGDPTALVRFYDQFNVQALAVPYFQPPVLDGYPPAYHMFLASFDPSATAVNSTGFVDGSVVRSFLEEYLAESGSPTDGGSLSEDDRWLLSFYDGDDIPLIPILAFARLPDPDPPGYSR